jgi:hypothetical protein
MGLRHPHEERVSDDAAATGTPPVVAGPPVLSNTAFAQLISRTTATREEIASQGAGPLDPGIATAIRAAQGGGSPLAGPVRADLEQTMGVDLSAVRVHVGDQALMLNRAVQADAFTTGTHIFFGDGGYDPASSSGRELLAHEVTHVVQQSTEPGGQARVSHPDEPAEVRAREVGRAASRAAGAGPLADPGLIGYLQATASNRATANLVSGTLVQRRGGTPAATDAGPTPDAGASAPAGPEPPELTAKLDQIAQRYREMIVAARGRGANVAADNLQRFLDGTGGVAVMGVPWLRGFEEVTGAEATNEERFETSLNKIANEMNHGDRRTLDDHWDRMLTAGQSSELFYASGTSTITSRGTFELSMIEDTVSIFGTVHHHWHDPYDWHAGLSASIPGFGSISDEDALLLQRYRGAKPFMMVSDWDRSLSATIKVGRLWNTKTFNWTGP